MGTTFVSPDFGDNFALARYNPNGSLDTSFSGDGKQVTDFSFGTDRANGVALQGDGKIVAVGQVGGSFALARYNANGSLDTSFSGDGQQTTDFGGSGFANGVALQTDGKIVAVGSDHDIDGDFALARYNTDGSLDTSFSGDGKQTTGFGGADRATEVALQADGKIVAVGFDDEVFNGGFALARYNTDGSLDTSFSGDGKQTTEFGGRDGANGVALQGDGKIIAVGMGGVDGDFALARYNPNGSLDPSFSGDGKKTTEFGGSDRATGVALQADGKIVAVGFDDEFGGDFALARYNPNGSPDSTFSGDGSRRPTSGQPSKPTRWPSSRTARSWWLAQRVQGWSAAATSPSPDTTPTARLTRASRATAGRRPTSGPSSKRAQWRCRRTAGLWRSGDASAGSGNFALARYRANGTLDPNFSGDGRQTTDFGGDDGANGVALQGAGRIVAVGVGGADTSGFDDFALARYNPNGSLDPSFSGDGKKTTDFGSFDGALGVALQPDGKIIAVGGDGDGGFALARYKPNGPLDPSFSGDGTQTTDSAGFDAATGVALQADGKIIAVGSASGGPTGGDFALARYNPNGSLDPTFRATGGAGPTSGVTMQQAEWRSSLTAGSSRLGAASALI